MLKCRQITEQASHYIDGELSLWGRLQYRVHLLMCHHCRTFIYNFRTGIRMLRHLRDAKSDLQRIEKICEQVRRAPKE